MSNDTDRTTEDDLIYRKLVELVKLIERPSRKVKSLHIEFEFSDPDFPVQSTRMLWRNGLTTEQVANLSKVLTEAESESNSRGAPRFVLRPVDENDPMTDAFIKFLQDQHPPH